MTDSNSFSITDGVNPPASASEPTSVNSENEGSTVSGSGVNLAGKDVNLVMPLVRSGAPGALGWMDATGTFLAGPYAGTTMLDWALAYARHGWHVFQMRTGAKDFYGNCPRCNENSDHYDKDAHAGGKNSCTAHPEGLTRCHGLYAATRSENAIRQWWGVENPHGNIGLNCGASGIALVDTDIKHPKGKYGDQSIARLEAEHGAFPVGPRARTATGGWHWLFALPEGLRSSTGYTDDKGRGHGLADHVDIKATGGLMVAAPSIIYDKTTGRVTGQYVWENDGQQPLPPLPGWVVPEIKRRETPVRPAPPTPSAFARAEAAPHDDWADYDETKAHVLELADDVRRQGEGGRNQKLLSNAKNCFQYAEAGQISHAEVESIFEDAMLDCGLPPSDIRTIRNARNMVRGQARPWLKRRQALPVWGHVAQQQASVPAPRTEFADALENAHVAIVTAEEEGEEGTDASLTAVPSPAMGGGSGMDDGPAVDQAFLDEVREYQPDHLGQARYFCDIDGAKLILRWNLSAGAFMKYDLDRGHWRQDDGKHTLTASELTRLGIKINDATDREIKYSPEMEIIRQSYKGGVKKEEVARAKKIIEMKRAWPKLYGSAAGAGGILTFTRTLVDQCTALDFDRTSGLLNFANGTYDVTTGQMRGHSMTDMLTHQVGHTLDMSLANKPLEEVAPHFHKLVTRMCAAPGEVAPETHEKRVAAVMRALGYALHGSNPEKKMIAFVGGTDIGKTEIFEIIGQLLGSQLAWTGARPQLLIEGKGERHDSEEYSLAGRRMVLVNELKEGQVLDEGQVLRFIGPEGTTVSLRRMRQEREDHWITWKMFVTTNELPRARMTPQIMNRLMIMQLSQIKVPKEEQYDIKRHILDDEAEAVLAHLVKEWRSWYVNMYTANSPTGLVISDDMTEALDTYKESNRPLELEFMDECTEKGEGIPLSTASTFWSGFQQWMKREHPDVKRDDWPGRNAFYAAIRTLDGKDGVQAVMEHKGGGRMQFRGLRGIKLLPPTLGEMNQMRGF